VPHECTTCGRTFEDGSKQMLSGCPNCGGNKFQFQPAGRDSGKSTDATSTPATESAPGEASTVDDEQATLPESQPPTTETATEADVEPDMAELPTDAEQDTRDADASDQPRPAASTTDDPAEEFRDAEIAEEVGDEDHAQSDARSGAASPDEISEARREMAEAEEERLSAVEESNARGTPQGPPRDTPSGAETEEFDLSGAVGPDDGEPVEKQPVADSAPESEAPVSDDDDDLQDLRSELNEQFESIKITAPGQYELNLMELYDRKEYIISLQEDGRYVIEMADDYGIDD